MGWRRGLLEVIPAVGTGMYTVAVLHMFPRIDARLLRRNTADILTRLVAALLETHMKLSDRARKQGISYLTAWR